MADAEEPARAFKTGWFAKAARKALIDDGALCEAIEEVRLGRAVDEDELKAFRKLADLYAGKTDVEIEAELRAKERVEICNGRDA